MQGFPGGLSRNAYAGDGRTDQRGWREKRSTGRRLVRSAGESGTGEAGGRERRLATGGGFRDLEATGGFEPPNRGFADLRLSPLGYVASTCALSRCAELSRAWCRGRDLNPHGLSPTAPSRPRVYQFHHLGPSARQKLYHKRRRAWSPGGSGKSACCYNGPVDGTV